MKDTLTVRFCILSKGGSTRGVNGVEEGVEKARDDARDDERDHERPEDERDDADDEPRRRKAAR